MPKRSEFALSCFLIADFISDLIKRLFRVKINLIVVFQVAQASTLLIELDEQPEFLRETVFTKLFAEAQLATLTPDERWAYTESLKDYRDLKNSLDTAYQAGREQGRKMATAL